MADGVIVRQDAARLRVTLDAPKGNAITDAMVGRLRDAIRDLPNTTRVVVLESAGRDFSFGSSLDEHVPSRMPAVLPRFHALVREWLEVPAVTIAAVAGRCLGGGFELALACDVIVAADDAMLGLPEIGVGAFPPVGSILLPLRVGAARASSAVLTGEARSAQVWHEAGLVERVVPRADLASAVDEWSRSKIECHSAAALRTAARAARLVVRRTLSELLPEAERLYLQDLLKTEDAAEGVAAFLEKRTPRWTNR